MRKGCGFSWVIPVFLCLSIQSPGQDSGARLRGTVLSVSGTAVAQAILTLQDSATGSLKEVVTDTQGLYEATGLTAGNYRVVVSAAGFESQDRERVKLVAGDTVTVDFQLEPRSAKPTQAGAPGSEQARPATTANVIDESQLAGLPMNGRSYTQLATLQAGVSDPSGGNRQGGTGGGSITVSGGRGEWNGFLLDGTDINDTDNRVPRSAAGGQLGADAVLQVQVFSTNYGAQYGRAAGGVMNAVTRSGSNDWHGSVFEFLRNSKLDARNFFDKGSEPPPFKRNQFGGTLTGPIRRDRTFFMASFESLHERLSKTVVSFVPDNDVRRGVLALPGREPVFVVPQVMPHLALYPPAERPVLDSSGRPTGIAENRSEARLPTTEYFFVVRVDQRLRDQDALFARYTFSDASTMQVGMVAASPRQLESRQQYVTLAETHFFSPALLNTIRLSFTRPASQLHVRRAWEIPSTLYFVPNGPRYGSLWVTGLTVNGQLPEAPWQKVMNSYQFADDLIYRRGNHTWRAGMQAERFQWNNFDSYYMGAEWVFSSLENFLRAGPTGTKLLVALPGSSSERAFRQSLFAFYLQDDYKLISNFTLNLGLRYEFTTMIRDIRDRMVYLLDEISDTEPRLGRFMSQNPTLRNLAPRIGLSWAPGNDRGTRISAGFGIYYDPIIEYSADNLKNSIPFFQLAVRTNFDASKTFPNAVAAGGRADQIRVFEYHNPKTPTVYRYDFSVQRDLISGLRVQATYLGARGNHLLRTIEANLYPFPVRRPDGSLFFPPDPDPDPERGPNNSRNPAFGSMQKALTDAQSFYNSFFVSVDGRFGTGLSLGANYTYSKSVDDASSVGGGGAAGSAVQQHYGLDHKLNRGLSDFDNRHRFSLRYFYSLPFGPSQQWLRSGWLSHLVGGWRIGGILTARAGQASDVLFGIPADDSYLFISQRPNLVPGRSNNPTRGGSPGCKDPTTGQTVVESGRRLGGPDLYFDPCAFSVPSPGTIGNVGRGTLIGPSAVNLDFSLQKDFSMDSQRTLQFRAEFFNLPNHPNFLSPQRPGQQVFRDAKGRINPSAGKLTDTSTTSRQIQFALRLSF